MTRLPYLNTNAGPAGTIATNAPAKFCISSSSAGALTNVTLAARTKHAANPAANRRTFVCIILRQAFQFLCGSKWRPTPNDNSRTSLPLKPQPTTRSRSSFLNDMPYTEAPAKGRGTRGPRWTKENKVIALRVAQLQPNKRAEVRLDDTQKWQR